MLRIWLRKREVAKALVLYQDYDPEIMERYLYGDNIAYPKR